MNQRTNPRIRWTYAGSIFGTDTIVVYHIENFLTRSGIESVSEGSREYLLYVRQSELERARALLVTDSKERGHWFSYTGTPAEAGGNDESLWVKEKHAVGMSLLTASDVDALVDLPEHVRRVLKDVISRDEYLAEAVRVPYVESVILRKRSCTDWMGRDSFAYDVRVDMSTEPDKVPRQTGHVSFAWLPNAGAHSSSDW